MKKYLLVLAAAIAIATGSWYAYAAHSRNMPLLPSQAPAAATANLASAQDLPRLQVQNLVQYIAPDSATSRTFSWQVEPGMTQQPRVDLRGLVSRVVVQHQVQLQILGYLFVDRGQEADELGGGVAGVVLGDHRP